MENISSLLCRLFSKTLHSPMDSLGFAMVHNNEFIPDDLKTAVFLLLIVRQTPERVTHQISGLYQNQGNHIHAKTFTVNAPKLPNVKDTEFTHHPLQPDASWSFIERPDTKTYFWKSSSLWMQNTILNGHISYIVQEKQKNRNELQLSTGFLSQWLQKTTTYKKTETCHSILKWIKENNPL